MKNNEHEQKVGMAQEVGKLLPETIEKVEHYKDVLRAEAGLLNQLNKRQDNFILKILKPTILLREKVELINVKNGILYKQKIYESYVSRKKRYEQWLDEMAVEIQSKFEDVFKEAKEITSNPRLVGSIQSYEEALEDRTPSIQEKVEFYLYMINEIENKKKHGKKNR